MAHIYTYWNILQTKIDNIQNMKCAVNMKHNWQIYDNVLYLWTLSFHITDILDVYDYEFMWKLSGKKNWASKNIRNLTIVKEQFTCTILDQ